MPESTKEKDGGKTKAKEEQRKPRSPEHATFALAMVQANLVDEHINLALRLNTEAYALYWVFMTAGAIEPEVTEEARSSLEELGEVVDSLHHLDQLVHELESETHDIESHEVNERSEAALQYAENLEKRLHALHHKALDTVERMARLSGSRLQIPPPKLLVPSRFKSLTEAIERLMAGYRREKV